MANVDRKRIEGNGQEEEKEPYPDKAPPTASHGRRPAQGSVHNPGCAQHQCQVQWIAHQKGR